MKKTLLTLLLFFTFVFSFSQTETITIPWNFFSVPAEDDPDTLFDTNITIEEGDTVEWVFEGFGHNVKSVPRGTFGTPGDDFTFYDAPYTYSYTFMDVGVFDFECFPHSSLMYGTITVVPEGTLSLDNVNKIDFSIYPNPSGYKLNINLAQNTNNTKIEVYDILGKRIHSQILTSMQSSINVSRWNLGVYLVKITNKIGTQTKRFVKE
jgi:hypothetical protein